MGHRIGWGIWVLLTGISASAMGSDTEEFIQELHSHPASALNRLPEIRDSAGHIIRRSEAPTLSEEVRISDSVEAKDRLRSHLNTVVKGVNTPLPRKRHNSWGIEAEIGAGDDPADVLQLSPASIRWKLKDMSTSASLKEAPWSDSYWPYYLGILGQRYADPEFPGSSNWSVNFKATHGTNSAARIVESDAGEALNQLSPSEKYDLLVGAKTTGNWTLTDSLWSQGEEYFRDSGKVETWMGICHGWAVASLMLPRPSRSVKVSLGSGEPSITFYPSDIKGLASLLWAETNMPSNFIGGRCNDKNPPRDSSGRVTSPDCFDTNPGTWHVTVVNQISQAKKGFVMDATYDYQVWNQPVFSYSYTYFNPQTGKRAGSASEASIKIGDYRSDPFSQYRSSRVVSVAGIEMSVSYGVEAHPTDKRTSGPADDQMNTVVYRYDVELDDRGNIIGGEWYTNFHPDFVWTPAVNRAISLAESAATGSWNPSEPVPASWKKAATRSSQSSQPLAKIVEALIR